MVGCQAAPNGVDSVAAMRAHPERHGLPHQESNVPVAGRKNPATARITMSIDTKIPL